VDALASPLLWLRCRLCGRQYHRSVHLGR